MGIQGLLRNLHPLLVPPPSHPSHQQQNANNNNGGGGGRRSPTIRHNIRQFASKSLAIDASSWLHRAAYTCAETLVESTESGVRSEVAEAAYCKYMLNRCTELLTSAKIDTIYLVFDGIRVPLKSGTNAEREAKRRANLNEARRLKQMGLHKEAGEKYKLCVKGNEEMARVVAGAVEERWGKDDDDNIFENENDEENGLVSKSIKRKKSNVRVKCIWSPYEADAQLAKLCVDGYAHAVVTEDSDVLVYSAVTRSPFPIIYKLDRHDGSCDVVTMDWLLNPTFLRALNNSNNNAGASNNSRARRRRRRRRRERDLEYIYNDGPLDESSDDDDDESSNGSSSNGSEEQAAEGEQQRQCRPCEVEYDDMGFAPIRRALPCPSSSATNNGRSGGNNNRRGGGKRRRGSNGSASDGTNFPPIVSYLRSFANKEASNPGAGVRLFVQACVLSGCDYVANRLSKVGPVTAMKLVKEVSHRDAAVRFERVLKSLPKGSKLIAEEKASSNNDEDGDGSDNDYDEDDDDDFLSPPDNDRTAKEKYEELLSKSEAVFYYHLAKDLGTGNIVPLVSHNKPGNSQGDSGDDATPSLEVDASYRPCTERFESGLTFVGSATEARKNKLEPLLPLRPMSGSHRPAPLQQQQSNYNGGWMTTNKHKSNGNSGAGGRNTVHKHNTYQKNTNPYWQKQQPRSNQPDAAVALPKKETALDKYLKKGAQQKDATTTNNTKVRVGSGLASKTGIKPSLGTSNYFNRKGSNQLQPKQAVVPTQQATSNSANGAPALRKGANQFSAFAHPKGDCIGKTTKKSPLPTTTRSEKVLMKSPTLFSPAATFDYGGYTPPPPPPQQAGDCDKKAEPDDSIDDTDNCNNTAGDEAHKNDDALSSPVELLDDNSEVEEIEEHEEVTTKQTTAHLTGVDEKTSVIADANAFDYDSNEVIDGMVEETPQKKPLGFLSKYIYQTKSSLPDSCDRPRRVSTSPSEQIKTKNDQFVKDRGSSPENSIELVDLVDDSKEDEEDDVTVMGVNENEPNFNQPVNKKSAPKIKQSSSVNKQPFRVPYLHNNNSSSRSRTSTASSSTKKSSNNVKMSGGAILLGFARQAKTMPSRSSFAASARSAARSSIGIKRTSRFFDDTKEKNGLKSSSSVNGKRLKTTLKDFMVPSGKDT